MGKVQREVSAQARLCRVRRNPRRAARFRQRGKLTTLLVLLRDHADAVESDLRRWHGVRYSDRWRFDEDGQRRLTLREIWVLIQYLPGDSALILKDRKGARWGVTDYLLSDVFTALTGKPHPSRPKSVKQQAANAQRAAAVRRVERQFAARRRQMAAAQPREIAAPPARRALPAAPSRKGVTAWRKT
ncbi:hypothetical protein [Nocardia sp. NPDC055049]